MPIFALQRSYKYMMYATKQPSLRINQADLKCKNGCGFYGNADWDGYCSKCYRNHMDQERQMKARQSDQSKVSGFTKFEEKKRQQTDKKNKYLKSLPVFRKTSNVKDTGRPERHLDLRHANPDADKLVAEFISLFGIWGELVRHDFFKCVQSFTTKIYSELDNKPIEDIAEMAQKYYNLYSNRVNANETYQEVTTDARADLLDFFEKYVMVSLYSWLFCPPSTNDEEKDLIIQERIRKLSWVNAHHLVCCISETSIEVRDLVYTAITHLLGMDSMKAPQDKLSCVVNCCQSVVKVLQHCQGGPVSADEFLPALIFIVLKANPARLKSNMLYVTRFSNETRLMQGETGYYFTTLCCAVTFIENLTAESLHMSQQEFEGYMNGEITSVSAWESALVACEGMHQLCEHLSLLKDLSERTETVQNETRKLTEEISKFKDEINEKVTSVLDRTPLIIKTRKTPDDLKIESQVAAIKLDDQNYYLQNLQIGQNLDQKNKLQLDITPCKPLESLDPNLAKIDYDIDLSDLSGGSENLTPEKRFTPDPFSPVGSVCTITQEPLIPSQVDSSFVLPFVEKDNPTSPIKVTSQYSGFSKQGWQIPNIPCITGDLASTNTSQSNQASTSQEN